MDFAENKKPSLHICLYSEGTVLLSQSQQASNGEKPEAGAEHLADLYHFFEIFFQTFI